MGKTVKTLSFPNNGTSYELPRILDIPDCTSYTHLKNQVLEIVVQEWIKDANKLSQYEKLIQGGKIMVNFEELIINALDGHIRVNTTLKTVEIFNEFGVQLVLRNLDELTFKAFAERFMKY